MPRGKVNRFRGKTRHFPQGWKCQVPRERSMVPVPLPAAGESEPFSRKNPALSRRWKRQVQPERPMEPVPRPATGESEPFSPKNPALSPGEGMASAAREACGSGAPAGPGGKVSYRKRANFSTFTMSSTSPKRITLIIKHIQSGDLLDCPLFAIKPPFHPRSSRCSFSECLYTKHFPKQALLDLLRSLMPRGKVNRFRRKTRHFPRGSRTRGEKTQRWDEMLNEMKR